MFQEPGFENFVVGKGSRTAFAAAEAAARMPGQLHNPLYLYGPSGCGKTHLLSAVANRLARTMPQARVVRRSCDELVRDLITFPRSGSILDCFMEGYRTVDVLLVDDLWILGGKGATQEILSEIVALFVRQNKQVVLASELHPDSLKVLTERILRKCSGALFVDLALPDREDREAIVRQKAQEVGLDVDDAVCGKIADQTAHAAGIEGKLKRLAVERRQEVEK